MNSAQRIFEILDTVPEVAERADPVPLPAMRGTVELRGVTFGYEPNKPVLHEIDLRVAAGARRSGWWDAPAPASRP